MSNKKTIPKSVEQAIAITRMCDGEFPDEEKTKEILARIARGEISADEAVKIFLDMDLENGE